ncbi:MAG TPA: hypothetical protein VN736_19270 [Candidatus Limnocylindrales bacterium]|nr:hypothetical protein [Candidatus Limnocylindrales bacterium]
MAHNRAAWLVVAVAAVFFGWRLFAPPAIGIADNGDFPKVTGPFWIGPAEGRAAAEDHNYYPLKYVQSTNYIWNSGVYTAEELYTWLAFRISRPFSRGSAFDIRWLGLVHMCALLLALWWVARVSTSAACIAVFLFGDAAYLAYCNTFYMDAAGFTALALLTAAAVNIAVFGYSRWRLLALTAAALLYVTAKIQHAPMGIAVAVLMVLMLRTKWAAAAAAVIVLAVIPMMHSAPQAWRGEALFDAVFYGITPGSPTPLADLKELGLGEAELPYVGMHVYSPGAPTDSAEWSRRFVERVPYWKVARFYATHPARTLGTLWYNLYTVAWELQEPGMGNYPRHSGMPPGAKAPGYWSGIRSWVLRHAPLTAPLWVLGCIAWALRSRSRLAWLCAALALMSAGEFCIACLGDAVETNRHLFLYHVLTEITICFALTRLLAAVRRWVRA